MRVYALSCVLFKHSPILFDSVENEDTLKYLATVYAENHPRMHLGNTGCPGESQSMFF